MCVAEIGSKLEMKQLGFVDVVGNSEGGEAMKHPPTSASGVLRKVSYNTVLKVAVVA